MVLPLIWPVADLPCGMWDLPRAGIEPMSPALTGGFFTTEPPGKLDHHALRARHHAKCSACIKAFNPHSLVLSPYQGGMETSPVPFTHWL